MKSEISEKSQSSFITDSTSKRISSLRYLLIVFVVFIHATNIYVSKESDFIGNNINFPNMIQFLISYGFAYSSVPLFLLFSSYLQFKKNYKYSTLLKKKTKSILIPFFLWPLLNIALFAFAKILLSKIVPSLVDSPNIEQSGWTFSDWITAFFGITFDKPYYANCYVIQFWFLRDLFILILISPFLKLLIDKFPFCTLLAILFLNFTVIKIFFFNSGSILYYVLGIYWAKYDFDLFKFSDELKWKALIPLFLIFCFINIKFLSAVTMFFASLISCLMLLKFSSLIVKNEKLFALSKNLSKFSFWIFAIHMPFLLRAIQKVWTKIFPASSSFLCLAEYFGVAILTVAISTLAGIILRKICPPFFRLLNGGRG